MHCDGPQNCVSCLLIETIPRAAADGGSACLMLPLGIRWLLQMVNQLSAPHSPVGQVHVVNCSLVSCPNTGTFLVLGRFLVHTLPELQVSSLPFSAALVFALEATA